MSRAVPADERTYARLHNLVEGLCIASGLPKPRIYVIDDAAPNAFATGRNPKHAAIAVTTGLLEMMTGSSSRRCWPTSSATSRTRTSW
jgi:heat shock protein HtpX